MIKTVGDLIDKLNEFPKDMLIVDCNNMEMERVDYASVYLCDSAKIGAEETDVVKIY